MPPAAAAEVCSICRSWKAPQFETCASCTTAAQSLELVPTRVIPISLYRKPSVLRDWLKYYKSGGEEFHPEYVEYLSILIARFMYENREELGAYLGRWTETMVVPSTARPDANHPLEDALILAGQDLVLPPSKLLLAGEIRLRHRQYDRTGYRAIDDLKGRAILIFDDVYTSGARAQSASAVLRAAGAEVLGIVVVGRRVNPDFNRQTSVIWAQQREKRFSYNREAHWWFVDMAIS